MSVVHKDVIKDYTVVHVIGGFTLGGLERLCLELLRHSPAGVNNKLVVLDSTRKDMRTEFQALGNVLIVYGETPSKGRLAFVLRLSSILRTLRPDAVLYYSFGLGHLLGRIAGIRAGVWRFLVAAQNPPHRDQLGKWRLIVVLSRILRVPIQSCSYSVETALRKLGVGLPADSCVIPNGCDVARINASVLRHRKDRPKRGLVIGMVARLDRIKDQETLVRAFARLIDAGRTDRGLELWLIGDGEERARLQSVVRELSAVDDVSFLGSRADIPELLGCMDIYAFSTTSDEGFGIALVEAMSAGLPVVASDVPACREVLGEGAGGQLVVEGDVDQWETALSGLVECESERRKWGRVAYERARTSYDISVCARRWYQQLIPRHRQKFPV